MLRAHYFRGIPHVAFVCDCGHTDTTLYSTRNGYTNWELSADRANAARRTLMAGGLTEDKVARGKQYQMLAWELDPNDLGLISDFDEDMLAKIMEP